MNEVLTADFVKAHRGGPTIAARLSVPMGRHHVLALCGPSGSGKTTILRCLAGLERPESGSIRAGDEVWFDAAAAVCLGAQRRGVGYLFQDYALFPHLSVADNIGYGLGHLPRGERRGRVDEAMARFGLVGMGRRRPGQISGGEQQRVALARTLVCRPRLLLLDEPLSALDRRLRDELRRQLGEILAGLAIPVVLISHDEGEVADLASEVIEVPMVGGAEGG